MRAKVEIFYKDSVFDPQGSTICQSLKRLGFHTVKEVRMGKVIDVELESSSPRAAQQELENMCKKLLANPVIESYKIILGETATT